MLIEQPIEVPVEPVQDIEDTIRAAPDAVEVRIVPLTGPTAAFATVTERIFQSAKLGQQVRLVYNLVAKERDGQIVGYEKRGEDRIVEPFGTKPVGAAQVIVES